MTVQERLLQVSAATIDRALSPARAGADGHRRHRTVVNVIRRQVPVRTFSDWRGPPPGFQRIQLQMTVSLHGIDVSNRCMGRVQVGNG